MLKVLIVDDEAPIRKWLEYCVNKMEEFTVCATAENGVQGLEQYRKKLPEIVITDIEMPRMSGIEMLKQIREIQPTYAIVLTSYESFSYVRESLHQGALEYILKTEISQESLTNHLAKAGKIISQSRYRSGDQRAQMMLRQCMMSENMEEVTQETLRQHGIELVSPNIFAADIWSHNGQSLQFVRTFLEKQVDLYNLRFASYGYDHLIVVGNFRREKSLPDLVEQCKQAIRSLPAVIGFSGPVREVERLPEALQHAKACCRLHFYNPECRVFWEDPVDVQPLQHTESWKIAFSKELYAHHFSDALAVKNQVLDTIQKEKPSDLPGVRNLCIFLATTLLHFTIDEDENLVDRVQQVEQEIQESEEIGELVKIMNRVFSQLELGPAGEENYSEPIQDALAYINAHYAEKLTLAEVANKVSFNPEYFSRVFTKEMGINFIAYLNQVRMERAAELLLHTEKKVYEIAEQVGYTSISYFSTAFKKYFGMTPNNYQAENRQK